MHGSVPWNTSERQRRSLIYRYVPWFMANGERAALEPPTDEPVRPPLPSWAAELSDAQRDALAPAGVGGDGRDARLMGWRPRHRTEVEAGEPHGTHGANGAKL